MPAPEEQKKWEARGGEWGGYPPGVSREGKNLAACYSPASK